MIIKPAHRTESVREYFFSIKNREMAKLNAERAQKGLDPIINLGIGAPDGMPPAAAIKALQQSAELPDSHKYQSYSGLPALKEAFAAWYKRYYGVTLDPVTEIQPLMGSKEGILIIFLTFINEGDKVLIPDPSYPTYTSAAEIVGADVIKYDLLPENNWWPDIDALEKMDLTGVKMMWTNYPGMPTGAKATPELYQRLVDFALRHNILLVNDNPYSFILNDQPLSMLAAEGAKECVVEMNSLSKAHNMSGWRVGLVAGAADYIKEILKVKSQMDSGTFKPVQIAAIAALEQGPEWFEQLNAEYRRRREAACNLMDLIGAECNRDSAGLFVWGRVKPDNKFLVAGRDEDKTLGERLSNRFLYDAGVFITPGFIFGHNGENYIRASLCAKAEVLEKAAAKIKNLL
ncbi:MAG: pyridoxal phosphate-dependent aminotransferase [Candidatus Cryptobacteroides sp.]